MISMYYGKIGICPLFNYVHPDYVKCVLAPIKKKKKKNFVKNEFPARNRRDLNKGILRKA